MSRNINPFGLRMPAELRQLLKRQAELNGRSLNAEIVARLRSSFEPTQRNGGSRTTAQSRELHPLTDAERAMLAVFRTLPPEKQLAFLSLFR